MSMTCLLDNSSCLLKAKFLFQIN